MLGRMERPVPVYVVDDQAAFRAATAALLASCDGFTFCGGSADAVAALAELDDGAVANNGIVLMDINMPGMNGFDATRRLRDRYPDAIVVLMSTYADADVREDVASCGASGYVHKEQLSHEVLSGVWTRRTR